FELARIRYGEAKKALANPHVKFTKEQALGLAEPLILAREQAPPLPETYGLLCEIWLQSAASPPVEQLEMLREGARLFPLNRNLIYLTALVEARNGLNAESASLAELGLRIGSTNEEREPFLKLKAGLELENKNLK